MADAENVIRVAMEAPKQRARDNRSTAAKTKELGKVYHIGAAREVRVEQLAGLFCYALAAVNGTVPGLGTLIGACVWKGRP